MSEVGKQALFAWVQAGHGLVGTYAAADTFHTGNETKQGPERFHNHSDAADPCVKCCGGEWIIHGAPQVATSLAIDSVAPVGWARAPGASPHLWYLPPAPPPGGESRSKLPRLENRVSGFWP